jgi:hypothetical protein
MESLGYVNAEGGPLSIVDGVSAAAWDGADGSDYDLACALFDLNLILAKSLVHQRALASSTTTSGGEATGETRSKGSPLSESILS